MVLLVPTFSLLIQQQSAKDVILWVRKIFVVKKYVCLGL